MYQQAPPSFLNHQSCAERKWLCSTIQLDPNSQLQLQLKGSANPALTPSLVPWFYPSCVSERIEKWVSSLAICVPVCAGQQQLPGQPERAERGNRGPFNKPKQHVEQRVGHRQWSCRGVAALEASWHAARQCAVELAGAATVTAIIKL